MIECSLKVKKKSSIKSTMKTLEDKLPKALEKVLEHGQQTALNNKIGNKDKTLIPFVIEKNGKNLQGRLYTNFDYASFLEYGTGIKAELPHIGNTKTFIKSGYRYWYLPKEKADAKGREFAPSRIIEIDGKQYYIMYSQSPRPFMRPTAFELEQSAVEILKNELTSKE